MELTFAVGWAAFWAYWLVAAFFVKRGRIAWSRELRIRALIAAIVIVLVCAWASSGTAVRTPLPLRGGMLFGLMLFAVGLGLAIWARVHIGRNWGGPMTQKDEPELVTSGPYRLVRHPIYTGILVAVVGTAVTLGWLWLIAAASAGIYLGYSATVEERYRPSSSPTTIRLQALHKNVPAVHLLKAAEGCWVPSMRLIVVVGQEGVGKSTGATSPLSPPTSGRPAKALSLLEASSDRWPSTLAFPTPDTGGRRRDRCAACGTQGHPGPAPSRTGEAHHPGVAGRGGPGGP